MIRLNRFLVRNRVALFIIMAALTLCCAFLIPYTNINTDMTKYLPDTYQMRQGMDVLQEDLPAMHDQLREFGTVFADGNDLIPNDLPRALITGFSLACVVLFIMCSSFVEVLLFLLTIGFAVVLNMGTNALLPSVSMMTHMLANILQMVLSMDYCIILMNRYRQEKAVGLAPVEAMENAVSNASASILSSAFTTIVSLLMLIFMKIKIGADMGTVLAKGVTISLLCNFTVLPCLIIWFDKAIEKTRKKVPAISAAPLARFEVKFRIPLAVLFIVAFVTFAILQRRTPTSFSPDWKSAATSDGPETNDMLLLYRDSEAGRIPALLDTLANDPKVTTCLSYPSLVDMPMTASEMAAFFNEMSGGEMAVPEDLLGIVYYARSHPERDEKFSLDELLSSIDELRSRGLIDREIDLDALFASGTEEEAVVEIPLEEEVEVVETAEPEETTVGSEEGEKEEVEAIDEPEVEKPQGKYGITYEQATTPLTAAQMAEMTGLDGSKIAMIFRMAGKARGTMMPLEFVIYVQENVLTNRRFAAFIPKGADKQLQEVREELEAVISAGPEISPLDPSGLGRNDNEDNPSGTVQNDDVQVDTSTVISSGGEAEVEKSVEEEEVPLSPLERLAEMALSGHRYSSTRVYRALRRVGIPVTKDELSLLYLYNGAKRYGDPSEKLSTGELLDFVADTLLQDQAVAPLVGDSLRNIILESRDTLLSSVSLLRGLNGWSAAVVMSDYDVESAESFAYIERTHAKADAALEAPHYWIGASEMYKELKDGFPAEVMLLTILTVLSIFLIVAVTFNSVFIPFPLVMTVLTGIYADVWAVGANGQTMYFISYLIVQGILMGATIDYSILFTGYYLRSRKTLPVKESIIAAYDGSIHSILTSGLILALVPFAMSFTMSDAMICSILKSISAGAATILLLILLVLPGVIAALDKPIMRGRYQ